MMSFSTDFDMRHICKTEYHLMSYEKVMTMIQKGM